MTDMGVIHIKIVQLQARNCPRKNDKCRRGHFLLMQKSKTKSLTNKFTLHHSDII